MISSTPMSPKETTSLFHKKSKKGFSVLKKCSAYCSCLHYFEDQRSLEELMKKHKCAKTENCTNEFVGYASDDCLMSLARKVEMDPQTSARIENASWRRWRQTAFNLKKMKTRDGLCYPETVTPSSQRKIRVSFSEQINEMIIPPRPNPFLTEDPDYEEEIDDEPTLVDNLGSVCCNILLTVSSLLAPYYSDNKKLSSWLY